VGPCDRRFLGNPADFGIDVELLIRSQPIPTAFRRSAGAGPLDPGAIPEEEIARRRDFRGLDVVTIDGETARDFDDAVHVERPETGTGPCRFTSPT